MSTLYLRKQGSAKYYSVGVYLKPIVKISQSIEKKEFNYIAFTGVKGSKIFTFTSTGYDNFIKSFKITNDKNGCRLCEISFLKDFDFEIEPFTKLQIFINNEFIFTGYLDYLDDSNIKSKNDITTFKFKGLIEQLKRVRVEKIYPANTKIINIIDDIVKNYVANETDTKYNSSLIDFISNQTQISANLETSKSNVYELIDKLAKILNFAWGVNEKGEFFCYRISNNVLFSFFENVSDIEFKKDFKNVRNSITIKRQSAQGTGETGWRVAYQTSDLTSISKYGKKFYDLQVPGFFDDISCQIIANNILNEFKEPKESAIIKKYKFKNNIIKNFKSGFYNIIKRLDYYFDLIDDFDDLTKINFNNTDTSASEQITNIDFISGSGAFRIYNIQANSTKIYKLSNLNISGFIDTIYFYAKFKNVNNANHKYFKIKIGIGENSYSDNIINFSIETEYYNLYKIVFNNPLRKIKEIAIILDDNKNNIELFFDKMYCKNYNYKKLKLFLTKIEYILNDKEIYSNLEFNYERESFENFIQGLLSEVEMLKFVSERR
jgi:hypothetical protein